MLFKQLGLKLEQHVFMQYKEREYHDKTITTFKREVSKPLSFGH